MTTTPHHFFPHQIWTPRNILRESFALLLVMIISFAVQWQHFNAFPQKQYGYLHYLTPAVMIACGKGFVATDTAIPTLEDFFNLKRNSFSCSEIPSAVVLQKTTALRSWYYLIQFIGHTWKILGISWPALDLLLASLFMLSMAACYGVFRLGMGSVLASIGAILFSIIIVRLQHDLLLLRDCSQLPFLLTIIFLTGLLLRYSFNFLQLLLITFATALCMGIGFGFRPDVLIMLPAFFVILLFFQGHYTWRNIALRVALIVFTAACFILTIMPVLANNQQNAAIGSCLWHAPLLGTAQNIIARLGIPSPLYSWSYVLRDQTVYAAVSAYGEHFLKLANIIPCSSAYDVASWHMLKSLWLTFPADFLFRAYSSVITILSSMYALYTSIALLLCLAAINLRWAIGLLFLLLYFFAYPSILFSTRHYYYLLFWWWWPLGFFLTQAYCHLRNKAAREKFCRFCQGVKNNENKIADIIFKPVILFAVISLVLLSLLLMMTRLYQHHQVEKLSHSYQQAERRPVAVIKRQDHATATTAYQFVWPAELIPQQVSEIKGHPIYRAKLLNIVIGGKNCPGKILPLTIKYIYGSMANETMPMDYSVYYDYSATLSINIQNTLDTPFSIYLPVYFSAGDVAPAGLRAHVFPLQGAGYPFELSVPQAQAQCIQTISDINTKTILPVWTGLFLPPQWQEYPEYQEF